ncbi:type III-B CRISPR-associated protein Cas10/Cmr2 [Aerococcaceae bacterium WS4759]|uniref:Type III-B CRISPR-associated protein Cas10/Cmr2 n=1 Tax=Fundicoccus ignavus TaxID=2664442 RepID=A0A6I2GET6_9LACT|nr:type III-B CRISPR-associated protein Cas10/Cmr2 [Fundicoccus ignavus]MRI86360.1 type III-B CRISPR-associated protein Cas10/Cmr2 [Fundicoccus ignavus]
MEYLTVVSLGPVQSFIGSARKLEDYWSGSFLLSDITRRSIQLFEEYDWQSVELIQPTISTAPNKENFDVAGLPNRFLFRVETDHAMEEIMDMVETDIKLMVKNLLKGYVTNYFNQTSSAAMEAQINQQTSSMLELYWAFVPYVATDSFAKQRQLLEDNLASVKNIRKSDYTIEYGLPCTMCAQRSALVSQPLDENSTYPEMRASIRHLWGNIDENSRKIRAGEHLCAVCVAKRQQRTEIEQNAIKQGIVLNRTGFPSVSYFVEAKSRAESMASRQKTFDIERKSETEDNRYYAMVKFDGDNMGKWIAEADTLKVAQEKTAKLVQFAQKGVSEAKKNRHLRIIYAGGDDVLAVGAITDLLTFAADIRTNFSDEAKGLGPDRTASAGIVIVPEIFPLYKVIQAANEAESLAKSYHDDQGNTKNAFCLTFIRRSGQIRQVILPFELENLSVNLLSYLMDTAQLWEDNGVSRSLIYHFQLVFQSLNDEYQRQNQSSKLAFSDNRQLVEEQFTRLIRNLSELKDQEFAELLALELTELYCTHIGNFNSFIQLLEMIAYLASINHVENKEGSNVL